MDVVTLLPKTDKTKCTAGFTVIRVFMLKIR